MVVPGNDGAEAVVASTSIEGQVERSILHHALKGDEGHQAVILLTRQHADGSEILCTVDEVREVGVQRETLGGAVDRAFDIPRFWQVDVRLDELLQRRDVPDVD